MDPRLIIGDLFAPMFFDRYHHVILVGFVLVQNDISWAILGECIDNIYVVPASRKDY